jgi:mannose-6-phosphate isomerase-like protein (cupin superfamily)
MAPWRNVSADMTSDDVPTGSTAHISVKVAAAQIPDSAATRSLALFRHGTLLVKYYAPRGKDLQTPHTRDELYVVAQGRGVFFNGTSRHPFAPGDLLFAAANTAHRFEEFSDDFGVWVMFYGPENGEGGG